MNGEFPFCETDPLMDELKEAAFEYLLLHPGSEFCDWQNGLITEYPAEVVDALGTCPEEVFAALSDLWESEYEDPDTGLEQKISDWALAFANEPAVEIYYLLVEARNEIRRSKAR